MGVEGVDVCSEHVGRPVIHSDERITKLERIIGHLHEPEEDDHCALEFEILLSCDFNEADHFKYCEYFARSLSCDHVDVKASHVAKEAAAQLKTVSIGNDSKVGQYEVVGDVRHTSRSHMPTLWLQMQWRSHESVEDEDDPDSLVKTVNWHIEHIKTKIQKDFWDLQRKIFKRVEEL